MTKPTWQTHACFGKNCVRWAAGAPHKCEVGRCKRYERALAEWEAAQEAVQKEEESEGG
jgi:hypothetical protein